MNIKFYPRAFISILFAASFLSVDISAATSSECTTQDSNGHCVYVPGKTTSRHGNSGTDDQKGQTKADPNTPTHQNTDAVTGSYQDWIDEIHQTHRVSKDSGGVDYYAPLDGNNTCYTEDYRPGKQEYSEYALEDGMAVQTVKRGGGFELSKFCKPNDAKTFTSNDPAQPKGPTVEEMLQEVEDQFAKTDIQAPVLKQSYNLGSGQGEDNPNVYKNQAVNFYVDAPTARWEGDLMIGHVEMESYPTQMTIQYGNGDEGSFYTMGKPVSRARGEESRKTATSYTYKRSGNFHAYATVSYSGRFRVDGGDWQALDVVLTKETVDPLLIRVWWVDVGRVAGDCSYDDTRWGCKNDPTMGKKDNPNPRLRKADIRTGQRWHLNDSGDGDTEYSLHRDWPDM